MPAKSTSKRKKPVKKVSLSEFRSWLEGVEEMQSEEWHPSKEQWKTIREKIDNIKSDVVVNNLRQPQNPAPRHEEPVYHNPGPVLARNSGPAPMSELETVAPTRSAAPMQSSLLATAGQKTKTPDIDSVAGGYDPSFE